MNSAIRLVAAITIKEGLRNRAMQGILAIALLLCLVYITVIPMFAFDTGKVVVDLGSAFVTVAGLAIVVFLGIALLTKDIHQRTVCMILSRPISRTDYVLGKYCGLAITVLLSVVMIAGLTFFTSWLGTMLIPEMKPPRNFSWGVLGLSVLFQYLSLLLLMAVAFFFACLTTSEYLSMLFTMGVYVIGNTLETIIAVVKEGQFVQVGPVYQAMLEVVSWVFPNLSAFDLKVYLSYGLPVPWAQAGWTAAYGICYIGLLAMATLWIFKRKEIT
jgi:ABC-type transport system involved in multi-copper enzyme maturation permease subunit